MEIYNHTNLSIHEIELLPIIGIVKNLWRQRDITIYKHPTDEKMVISDGITFDKRMRVICEDPRVDWPIDLSPNKTIVWE